MENGRPVLQVRGLHMETFAGAFELLTTTLKLNGGQGGSRIIALTAPEPKNGTSTIAGNLAITVAATGRKVLLVDANFRSPAQHGLFNLNPSPGLAELLARTAELNDALQATRIPDLWILAAGAMTGSPHARLETHELDVVFDQLRAQFEFVVVDTAPVLRYSDALHLARVTNGTLLIVPERAPRRAAQEAKRRLDRMQATVLGVVINRSDPRASVVA